MPAVPFVGDIMLFGGNFAPRGWALCNGDLMSIAQNETLFNLIGTTYGGDGQTTFALPDLRGRIPIHVSSAHVLAEAGGAEAVTLTSQQIPAHTHTLQASTDPATAGVPPSGNVVAGTAGANSTPLYSSTAPSTVMAATAVGSIGAGQPHSNMAPFTCVTFCIALEGVFPSQS